MGHHQRRWVVHRHSPRGGAENLAPNVAVDAPYLANGQALPGGSSSGEPPRRAYYRLFLPSGVLGPGQAISLTVSRSGGSNGSYDLGLLSGASDP